MKLNAFFVPLGVWLLTACDQSPELLAESLGNPTLTHGDVRLVTGETKVTFPVDSRSIIIPMTIRSKVFRIQLDTGFNPNSLVLSAEAARSIGYNPPEVYNSYTSTEESQAHLGEISSGTIPGVGLGPFEFKELAVSVKWDESHPVGKYPDGYQDGIVGGQVLKYFTVILDQRRGSLTLDLDTRSRNGDRPLAQRWPRPYINYFLDGKKRKALIDTGSPLAIVVNSAFRVEPYKAAGRWFPGAGQEIKGISTQGSPGASTVILPEKVEILSKSKSLVRVHLASWAEGGTDILGLELFRGDTLRINYPRGLISLE